LKAIVLGGCGFIGSHVVASLLDRGCEVSVFARPNADRRNLAAVQARVRFIGGDFLNADDVARAVKGQDLVVHSVGSTLPGNSISNPVFDVQTNIVGSVGLFAACVEASVGRVVVISSGGTVYGIPRSDLLSEDHPLDPINPYGLSKVAIEKYLGVFGYQYGIDYRILRLSNPYGSRQRVGRGQGVIAAWMANILRDEPIELWGDGTSTRDYVAVQDAAEAVALAASAPAGPRVMNIGSGQGHTLNDILALIEASAGRRAIVKRSAVRRVDVPRNVLDVSPARRELGWSAKVPLGAGIDAMWRELSG
jgi:UDP-glucose 4-epimerase